MSGQLTETERAATLNAYLTQVVPQAGGLQISVGRAAESIEAPADLHLRLHEGHDEAADLLVTGRDRLRLVASAVPWNEIPQRLARLLKSYQVERCGRDTFQTWAGNLSEHDLSERLGLPGRRNG